MGKLNVNSRNNYLTSMGILDLIDYWTDQSVVTTSSPIFNSVTTSAGASVGTDLIVGGNLTVNGTKTILSNETLEIQDNIILLNAEETGSGVTPGSAGIEIGRGSLSSYRLVYEESSDYFKIGEVGGLQVVATREDNPLDKGVLVYNISERRLDSTQNIELPMTFSANENSSSSSTGSIRVTGGVGVTGNVYTDSSIYIKGAGYNNSISADTSDNVSIESGNNFSFIQSGGTNINIPQTVSLTFDGSGKRIVSDGTDIFVESNTGDVSLTTVSGGNINIPIETYLRWDDNNRIRYNNTDITLESDGNFEITPPLVSINTTPSVGSTSGSLLISGGIGISNTTDATSSTNGGTITTAGGMSVAKKLFVGDYIDIADIDITKTQVSGQGVNLRSRSRTITTASGLSTVFNSFEGGRINTSSTLPKASTVYIEGSPSIFGGGSITNSYSLEVNTGISRFGGKIVNSDSTISVSSGSGAVTLSGGLGISNTQNASSYSSGGTLTTAGGVGISKDTYIGGKLDIGALNSSDVQVSGQGITFRSRDKTLVTSSSTDTVFNSFEGGEINTTSTITNSSTVYISGAPSVTGGGSVTNNYALWIESGATRMDDLIYITGTTPSTSPTTGTITLSGGVGINNTTDAVSSGNGGTFTTSGGLAVGKKAYIGSGVFTDVGTGISSTPHYNFLTSNVSRFSFGLKNIETGGNTGSDLVISRNDDGGSSLNDILTINRSSGVTTFHTNTSSSSSLLGSIVTTGGVSISNVTDATSSINGGSATIAGGLAVAKKVFIGSDLNVSGGIDVDGITYLDQTFINTTDGVFSVTGSNSVNILVDNSSSFKTTAGSLTLDAQTGSLVLDGDSSVTIDSLSGGVSIDAGAASNFSTTSGILTISGIGVNIEGNSSDVSLNTSAGVDITGSTGVDISSATSINIGTDTSGIPVTIGHTTSEVHINDNLTVGGDFTVLGTTTSIESTLITVNDNAIVVNNMPSGTSDGGYLIRRYQTPNNTGSGDVTDDTEKESGSFQGGSALPDSLILDATASGVTDNYKGWWIKITSGTGVNQIRRILSYNGTTKEALLYSDSNNNSNNDGLDLVTAPASADTYSLYDAPYVGMFFDESANEMAVAGVSYDPSVGEFPTITSYFPMHAQSLIIETGFTSNGDATFDGKMTIDHDDTEALLVRKDGDLGDVFTVDTVGGNVTIANPVNTVASDISLIFQQLNSGNVVETYSLIESTIVNNIAGNLSNTLDMSVQNGISGLTTFMTLDGDNSLVDISTDVESFRVLNTTPSTSNSTGSLLVSGGVGISNTTDATSSTNGGSATLGGGLAVAKKVFVGGETTIVNTGKISNTLNALPGSGGSVNINGDLSLYNSVDAKILFNQNGQGAPVFTSRNSGSKIVLRGEISGSSVDYAIGNESGAQWYSVPTTSEAHKFYLGTSGIGCFDSTGIKILQPSSGITFNNGVNEAFIKEASNTTLFSPHTSGVTDGFEFADSTGVSSRIRINSDGLMTLGITGYSGTPGGTGNFLSILPQTFTDNITSALGTAPINVFNYVGQGTLSANNSSVTTTEAVNTFIGGAPIKGTNQSITSSYAVYIDNTTDVATTGSVTEASSLYIKGSPSGNVTNSYSIIVDEGISRFDGGILALSTGQVGTTENTFASYQGALNTAGDITLGNGTRQGIYFSANGSGDPVFTNRSPGSKIILKPSMSVSSADHSIGITSGSTWYGVPTVSESHKFYLGLSSRFEINNDGILLDSSGSSILSTIKINTVDASDDKGIGLYGGGGTGETRGAYVEIYGNENTGDLILGSGSGTVDIHTSGIERLQILASGEIQCKSTTETTGSGTGAVQVSGGVSIDKTLYVNESVIMGFNQSYKYTGDVSGELNIQSQASSIASKIQYFTNDGDNTDGNSLEIYGLGTPSSLVNTESLKFGYEVSGNNYVLKTRSSGSGSVRNLLLETSGNNEQIKLETDGSVSFSSTTASTSNSTGSVKMSGGLGISNTTNATSITDGGSFTSGGGGAFAKDVYIGGNLNVVGSIAMGVTAPTYTISNETNITGTVTNANSNNSANGTNRFLAVVFRFTPTVTNSVTTFEFTIPEVVTNFTNVYDITCNINGYHTDGSPESLENCIVYAVTGTTKAKVSCTSSGTDTHSVQVMVQYSV